MNKNGILIWICLIVLLFCGCADATDSSNDQAPTPIEEEQRIQDTTEIQCAENGNQEDEEDLDGQQAMATYRIATQMTYEFGETEIFAGQDEIGRYYNGVPYMNLSEVMKHFGWSWVSEKEGLIEKDNLQYRFEDDQVQRILLDERGSPYVYRFPLIETNEGLMIAQIDMEELLGLQSRWDPDARTLSLIEWGWNLPETMETSVMGDRLQARLVIQQNTSGAFVMEEPVSIRLMDKEGESAGKFSSGYSEEDLYILNTEGVVLVPGKLWEGNVWVTCRSRLLGVYSVKAEFNADTGTIEISQGPWVEFTLATPTAYYTKTDGEIIIDGTAEDKVVEVAISLLKDRGFEAYLQARLEGDGPFSFSYTPSEAGIFRVDIWTEEDGIRQNRTHFYFEKRP